MGWLLEYTELTIIIRLLSSVKAALKSSEMIKKVNPCLVYFSNMMVQKKDLSSDGSKCIVRFTLMDETMTRRCEES
jgi:hypothetical protein